MTKPLLVLLPGYDGNGSKSFESLIPAVNQKFQTLIVDYPYLHEESRAYSLDELAIYVHGKIARMEQATDFHVVGFSMGGFVAMRLARLYPAGIKSVTLISSSPELKLNRAARLMIGLTKPISQSRILANSFAKIYCSRRIRKLVRHLPLPVPQARFPAKSGYAVFGTLAKVIREVGKQKGVLSRLDRPVMCRAILFADDRSFPAKSYAKVLEENGFKVSVRGCGGHAESDEYWPQVGDFITVNLRNP